MATSLSLEANSCRKEFTPLTAGELLFNPIRLEVKEHIADLNKHPSRSDRIKISTEFLNKHFDQLSMNEIFKIIKVLPDAKINPVDHTKIGTYQGKPFEQNEIFTTDAAIYLSRYYDLMGDKLSKEDFNSLLQSSKMRFSQLMLVTKHVVARADSMSTEELAPLVNMFATTFSYPADELVMYYALKNHKKLNPEMQEKLVRLTNSTTAAEYIKSLSKTLSVIPFSDKSYVWYYIQKYLAEKEKYHRTVKL